MHLIAVGRDDVPPLPVSSRFRMQLPYFMTPTGEKGAPSLGLGEYWIRRDEAQQWMDDGFVEVVSPLSAEAKAEIELTEEHEEFLEWLLAHGVEHVRLAE